MKMTHVQYHISVGSNALQHIPQTLDLIVKCSEK